MVGDLRMWLGRDQTRQPTQMRRPPAIITEHPDPPGRSILSSQLAMSRAIDFTTVVVLMLAMSYMFGGLRVHDDNFRVELRTPATILWLLCIALYFYIPSILDQETFSERLSRRFAR